MAIVLGVDSSTGSTKVEARDLGSGQVVGQATSPHPPTTPPVSEQDPAAWWDALVLACAQLDEQVYAKIPGDARRLINRYDRDSLSDPARWSPNWNRSFEFPAAKPRALSGGLSASQLVRPPWSPEPG